MIAEGYSGLYRKVHELAQPLAIGFVVCATLFSLTTQAYILGSDASTLAAQFGHLARSSCSGSCRCTRSPS